VLIGAALGVAGAGTTLHADIVGICHIARAVDAVDGFGGPDFNGVVIDIWLQSTDPDDRLLSIFGMNIKNTIGGNCYYQSSQLGQSWLPSNILPPFETDALKHADSFVSIGGRNLAGESSYVDGVVVQMDNNGTNVDPMFGGPNACVPNAGAGWYNMNPNNDIGRPVDGKIFIGRFAMNGVEPGTFDIWGDLSASWNQGPGTEAWFDTFTINAMDPYYCMIDCNGNMIDDASDIANGDSFDCNLNGVPDECETVDTDCNDNGNPDWCDIADGEADKNENGVLDSCERAGGDINLDGCVGGDDLGLLLMAWGPCPDGCNEDINNDGFVSGGDLGIVLGNWDLCP